MNHPSIDDPRNADFFKRLQDRLDLIRSNSARRRRIREIKREQGETFDMPATIEYIALSKRIPAKQAAQQMIDALAAGKLTATGTLLGVLPPSTVH